MPFRRPRQAASALRRKAGACARPIRPQAPWRGGEHGDRLMPSCSTRTLISVVRKPNKNMTLPVPSPPVGEMTIALGAALVPLPRKRGEVRAAAKCDCLAWSGESRRRHTRVIPITECSKGRVAQRATRIGMDAGQMPQVLWLAVAAVEPRENAEDFRRPLGGKRRVKPPERSGVEMRIVCPARLHIACKQRNLQLLGHIDARILEERGDVKS